MLVNNNTNSCCGLGCYSSAELQSSLTGFSSAEYDVLLPMRASASVVNYFISSYVGTGNYVHGMVLQVVYMYEEDNMTSDIGNHVATVGCRRNCSRSSAETY